MKRTGVKNASGKSLARAGLLSLLARRAEQVARRHLPYRSASWTEILGSVETRRDLSSKTSAGAAPSWMIGAVVAAAA